MRVDITRQPLELTFVLFVILLAIFQGRAFLTSPGALSMSETMPLELLVEKFSLRWSLLEKIASLLLLLWNALIILRISTRNMMYVSRTYLPCIFYLIISYGIIPPDNRLSALLTAYLLLKGTEYLSSSFSRTPRFDYLFQGSLLIGTTILFHASAVTSLFIVPIAMVLFQRSGREIFVALVSLLLPVLICGYIYWIIGQEFTYPFVQLWNLLFIPQEFLSLHTGKEIAALVLCGLLIVLLILSIINLCAMARNMRTRAYKLHLYMLWLLLLTGGALIFPCHSGADLSIVAIPASLLLPVFFIRTPGLLSAILYILILVSAILSSIL